MIQAITLLVIAALVAIDQVIKIAVVNRFAAGVAAVGHDDRAVEFFFLRHGQFLLSLQNLLFFD